MTRQKIILKMPFIGRLRKTRVVDLKEPAVSVDFLGLHSAMTATFTAAVTAI
jgi:hypothetical protein